MTESLHEAVTLGYKHKVWKVPASATARKCKNYIREIVESLDLSPNPEKPVIALSIGDPTVYGNLQACREIQKAVVDVVEKGMHNGYAPSTGFESARKSVAEYLSRDGVHAEARDVILCSGCSSSLEMCITVLADGGKKQNILVPRPGFPIYRTLAECIGVEVKYYNLLPDRKWEIDLVHLKSQIDHNTAALVINNPSNPCGSVFDVSHLRKIAEIAFRNRIPIISDEIYEDLVFSGKFVSLGAIDMSLPTLICGGLAKKFLVPGWRMGWILIHDPAGSFDPEVRKGLHSLAQRTIGSNTLVQGALPSILKNTPADFYLHLVSVLKNNADLAYDRLVKVKGITPYLPQGTMYMMVGIKLDLYPKYKTGLQFITSLMEEESVFCLPGEGFFLPGYFRIVITVPTEILLEACKRIQEFCKRHYLT